MEAMEQAPVPVEKALKAALVKGQGQITARAMAVKGITPAGALAMAPVKETTLKTALVTGLVNLVTGPGLVIAQ